MEIVKKNRNSKIEYLSDFICLDSETSNNYRQLPKDKKGKVITKDLMCWINSIQILDELNNYTQLRKPSELITYLNIKSNMYGLNENKRLVVYVHNLAYDLSYLEQILYQNYKEINCLATDKHKYINILFNNGIEFRCSYRLSNKSLDKWSKDLNTEHKKALGTYDYSKLIYQDTIINKEESNYDKLDVVVLKECLKAQFNKWGDNVATTPLTSTGYIRRIARKKALADKGYKKNFERLYGLTTDLYNVLNFSKSGGFTYTSRLYRGVYLKDELIGHRDFSSHYPSQQRNYQFPVGKMTKYSDVTTLKIYQEQCKNFVCYVKVLISDIKLKEGVTFPFLQSDKLRLALDKSKGFKFTSDNGRVIESKGECVIYLSDKMFDIICEQYNFKYCIMELWRSKKDFLPGWFLDTVDEQFKNKSDYKKINKECKSKYGIHDKRTIESDLDLLLSKQLLNGIFGMSYENPFKKCYKFDNVTNEWIVSTEFDLQKQLDKFNKAYNSFMPFQFGCYTTELAKYELYEFIKLIGYDKCLYCDTDSIYYLKDNITEKKIEELNSIKHELAIKNNAFILTNDNKKVFYDIFDKEEDIDEFKALHSKCYAYHIIGEKDFCCTIAGVTPTNKKYGKEEITREQELGNIDNLEDGFVFKECGGTLGLYNKMDYGEYVINGHIVECGNGICVEETTKTISNSELKQMY